MWCLLSLDFVVFTQDNRRRSRKIRWHFSDKRYTQRRRYTWVTKKLRKKKRLSKRNDDLVFRKITWSTKDNEVSILRHKKHRTLILSSSLSLDCLFVWKTLEFPWNGFPCCLLNREKRILCWKCWWNCLHQKKQHEEEMKKTGGWIKTKKEKEVVLQEEDRYQSL